MTNFSVLPAPAGILKNAQTGRFHPIVFRPGPAPSSSPEDDDQRYKSFGHHAEGFDTLHEAKVCIAKQRDWCDTGLQWIWDGTDTPVMVVWFSVSSLKTEKAN